MDKSINVLIKNVGYDENNVSVDVEGKCRTNKELNFEEIKLISSWNPLKALEQLEKENPAKYQEVIKELETLIKNDH